MIKSNLSRTLDFAISTHIPVIILILVLGLFGNAKAEPIYMPYVPEKPQMPPAPLAPQKPLVVAEVRQVEPEYQRPAKVHEVAAEVASIDTSVDNEGLKLVLMLILVYLGVYFCVVKEFKSDK